MREFRKAWIIPVFLFAAAALPAAAGDLPPGVQFRIGGFSLAGGGDFWNDIEQTFTLDSGDFDGAVVGVTWVHPWGNHLEVGYNADFYGRTVESAVQGYVDSNGFPIFHDSSLYSVPLTVDMRILPFGRFNDRRHGRHSLQPAFYLGLGAGVNIWEYEEVGDFVDFTNDEIFFDRFEDRGIAFQTHALAGVEIPFGRQWGAMFEVRRSWADDTPDGDFAGLGKLKLGGTSAYVGATARF